MTRAPLATALAAMLFTLAPCGPAQALSFPIQYSGNFRLTVTVKNEWGSGLCANEAPLTITLQADGQMRYEAAGLETFLTSVTGQPARCEVRASGKTVLVIGSHDLQGRFSVPSGSASIPPMTGRYDEDSISAQYTVGPSYIEFKLISNNHSIALEPDPSQGFDFHTSILEGQGFKLVMHDPQGRDHLDLSTLKILVGSSDVTAYAMSRASQGIVLMRDESPDSMTRVMHFLPDPKKLMQGQDIFAIPFNNDWRIELRLCDKAQTCFNKVYQVYFGPYVSTRIDVSDDRCATPPDPFLKLNAVVAGNIGIDSPNAAIFLGLANPGLTDLWTYFMADMNNGFAMDAWWQGLVQPFIPRYNMPSGFLQKLPQVTVPMWLSIPAGSGPAYPRRLPFPGGMYKFIAAALDTDTGTYRMDMHPVQTCDR